MSTIKATNILNLDGTQNTLFSGYAIICDQKGDTTDAGTFTSGDWRTRDLNTEITDADNIVSISSNQFTLGSGTYLIKATAPAFDVARHLVKIYNVTTSSDVVIGIMGYSHTDKPGQNFSIATGRVVLTGDTTFEIRHRCQTSKSSTGLGVSHDFSGTNNIYTVVEIYKQTIT